MQLLCSSSSAGNAKVVLCLAAAAYVLCLTLLQEGVAAERELMVGFYSQTCPNAESVVASVVKEASMVDPRVPAMLLRLHFHDCFVQGCDGSILITNNEINGQNEKERSAFGHQGVGGDEEIQRAKTLLEDECPGVVSCADIVALAARDAVVLAGGVFYEVETGRKDGKVSNQSVADEILPDVNDDINVLKSRFMTKGFDEKDLVVLSGAHSIGTTACFFISKRLYDFSSKGDSDPSINPNFLGKLMQECPKGGDVNVRIPMDVQSEETFDNHIFVNIQNGFAVLSSDARLYDDEVTRTVVDSYVETNDTAATAPSTFDVEFGLAMVKLGRLDVKLGADGEIRKVCNSFNS
ncbi:unnamed protein product [Cuscuta epithymum]|uniref:Peroxidase n=1 Tax=Cuscuta epithymum TaxID=186058 RepID=A0AAV0GJ81_9ASTE|nr:unnamed protein product [Cuscuta epithymum]